MEGWVGLSTTCVNNWLSVITRHYPNGNRTLWVTSPRPYHYTTNTDRVENSSYTYTSRKWTDNMRMRRGRRHRRRRDRVVDRNFVYAGVVVAVDSNSTLRMSARMRRAPNRKYSEPTTAPTTRMTSLWNKTEWCFSGWFFSARQYTIAIAHPSVRHTGGSVKNGWS